MRDRFDTEDLEIIKVSAAQAVKESHPTKLKRILEIVGLMITIGGSVAAGLWAMTSGKIVTKEEAAQMRRDFEIRLATQQGAVDTDIKELTAALKDTVTITKVQDVQIEEHAKRFQRIDRRLERIEDRQAKRESESP